MFNKQLINIFHILSIFYILYVLITNSFNENNKKYITFLLVILVLYHLYRLFDNKEGMESVFGTTMHNVYMFDALPGYDKSRIVLKKGDVVVWHNVGEVEHSATADRGEFDSGYLKPGESYSNKFDNLGEYYYHCKNNGGWMKGLITVRPN